MEKTPVGATRFGPFAIDYSTGELLKRGRKIRLQNQPFQILAMLLERPREIVTRETALYFAVNKHKLDMALRGIQTYTPILKPDEDRSV